MQKPDYSNYTLSDLYDVASNIDQNKYPERYEFVISEIKVREGIQSSFPKETEKEEGYDWIKNLGIVSMIFGFLIILSSLTSFFTADMMETQQKMVKEFKTKIPVEEFANMIPEFPNWYKDWVKVKSLLSVSIGIIIIVISFYFKNKKHNFDYYLILILSINIILFLVNLLVSPLKGNFFIISTVFGFIWGNIVEFVFIGIILSKDRQEFRKLIQV